MDAMRCVLANAPELEEKASFVGRWMDILRPGYERVVASGGDEAAQIKELEKQSVLISLENLMTFPFVRERVESGDLALHGVSIDIRSGAMIQYDPANNGFVTV